MKIIEVKERTPILVQELLKVWEKSVRATHLFLSVSKFIKEVKTMNREIPIHFYI